MGFAFRYIKPYKWKVVLTIFIKILGTVAELFIPYALEYMLDTAAVNKNVKELIFCAAIMILLTCVLVGANALGNTMAIRTASKAAYTMRKDLFWKSLKLSGRTFDEFTLPSITSRMTADSYNVQSFYVMFQSFAIRNPLVLIGGLIISMMMDRGIGMILLIIAPITLALLVFLAFKGIPLYEIVQKSIDEISRIMRENITGIRVVKALSKESYEESRFDRANQTMIRRDRKASLVTAVPGPLMMLILNVGLVLCVYVGAVRVNEGATEPGVILAFLTYFNMILFGCMGLSRIILMMSKATASAGRIRSVIDQPEELLPIQESEAAHTGSEASIVFDHVSFAYDSLADETDEEGFAGEEKGKAIYDISFEIPRNGSLGIIGPTGCGKTTIINLLMRFYDTEEGHIFIDGKDIRSFHLRELRRKFSTVFQSDMVFADTLEENIKFGRDVDDTMMRRAADSAYALEFIENYENEFQFMSAAHGANLSGGQKQRILISRALAGNSEILILDDSSSALDYKTDAGLRQAIRDNYNCTSIVIAQRISSIMSLDQIIVMNEGRIIGKGTHEQLMKECPEYVDIYRIQMGEERSSWQDQ